MVYITSINYTPGGKTIVTLSDHNKYTLSAADISSLGLSVENEVSEEQIKEIKERSARFNAYNKAASSLSRSDFSKKGLVRRLRERGISEELAVSTVEQFEKKGYINDVEYANRIARFYSEEKNFGKRRVLSELLKREIDIDLANSVLQDLDIDDDENIIKLYKKKFMKEDISQLKVKKKVSDALLRYGYTYENIRSLFYKLEIEEDI